MRVYQRWKGHLLTPTLKDIHWTRSESLLQWHAKNGHENILFMNKKIFTIEGSMATRMRLMLKQPQR
jgi:hypothetical protein